MKGKAVGAIHALIERDGKQLALKTEHDRRVVEGAAAYLSSEDSEMGFFYSGWAQAALPHKRLPDDAHWQVQTDRVTLIVQPGLRAIQGGEAVSVGVPYGSRARLILLYLQTEALKSSSREVELGRSLHMWLTRLEIPIGGKSMRDVRDQAERISVAECPFKLFKATGRVSSISRYSIPRCSSMTGMARKEHCLSRPRRCPRCSSTSSRSIRCRLTRLLSAESPITRWP